VPAASGPAPRLYERACGILATRIRSGELAPGERLLESRVASQFGISRAPARQALAGLEAAGLVTRSEGRGYVVRGAVGSLVDAVGAVAASGPIRLASTPSWERIYREVEQAIVARTPFTDWRVIESELARCYGVSRTVARDVIARLQQRGIVKKDSRSHWYAPALTPAYVGELYLMRSVLEPVALVAAMPAAPGCMVAEMRRNLDRAIARGPELGGADLDELEAELHVRLLGYCGNQTLMEAIRLYQSLLIAHSFLYRWGPRLYEVEPFLSEHLTVIELLEAGRIDEAARELGEHLRLSLDRAVARLDIVARDYRPSSLPYLVPLGRS
jgi:DNA-binding GntR family transcriptional regulator